MLGIADDYERSPNEPKNEQQAGHSQGSCSIRVDCPRIGCNGLHQARRALLGIVRQVDVKGAVTYPTHAP
jgi:hypothetical protein